MIYSNKALTYYVAVTAVLEYLDLYALQVAIAAGDYPLDLFHLFMCYSGGSLLVQWTVTAKNILAVQPYCNSKKIPLVNSGFT